jgi:MOSC domain-containing protein YiiM
VRGTLVQVSVSQGGVPKHAVTRGVVTPLGLEGDAFRNTALHGGPDQALLLIAGEALAELEQLGFAVFPGALGENLTTSGLPHRQWRVGQRFRIGSEVIIELTKLRQPCRTLKVYGERIGAEVIDAAVKACDTSSPKWGRAGFYARVIEPGVVEPGAPIELLANSQIVTT